jgi:hypothetical protein
MSRVFEVDESCRRRAIGGTETRTRDKPPERQVAISHGDDCSLFYFILYTVYYITYLGQDNANDDYLLDG